MNKKNYAVFLLGWLNLLDNKKEAHCSGVIFFDAQAFSIFLQTTTSTRIFTLLVGFTFCTIFLHLFVN
jgi:hypothetical protein